jgi:hypothetical protein
MTNQTIFLLAAISMILYGSIFTMKYFGWPSENERKNKLIRSLRTGLSSTALLVGSFLLYFYWTSPEEFSNQWTTNTIIGGFLFCIAPMLAVLTVFSFIQFSALEKMQSGFTTRLREIKDESTADKKDNN